jgi:5'-phosphate synthase pdxT subunit
VGSNDTDSDSDITVGVLNLQGDVREHAAALRSVGCAVQLVKSPDDLNLQPLSGLVLPGGESTTLSMLLESTGLFGAIADLAASGLPLLGTCAGLILLASEVVGGRPDQRSFGLLPAVVQRNGFGRQLQSFETQLEFGEGPALPAVFIRAPKVLSVGPDVRVLATLPSDSSPVLVRRGPILASCFHPELTPDRRVHALFSQMCADFHAA